MAKIGLKHFVYGLPNADFTAYTGGRVLGAIECNLNITNNDVKLNVDDGVKESDKSFSNGTIDINTDDIPDEDKGILFGHKVEDGEVICNANDVPPEIGFGFYGRISRNNVKSFRAGFLLRVQFSEPSDENSTKGESVEYKTQAVSGSIYTTKSGDYKREKTFETEEEAIEWLDNMVGYGKLGTLTVKSEAGSATGKTKITVTPAKQGGHSYKYKAGSSVTDPKYGDVCTSGYTDWDGTAEITARTSQKILIVEVDADNKAMAAGSTTVTAKA